jgi:adenosylcobinamide-GDP ribazoletransferase
VITELLAALGTLTRLPLRMGDDVRWRAGAAAYPLVGAVIGALAGVVLVVLGPREPTVAAILAIGVVALVTGGLHLDGLADTVDALLAPDPARAELARKDPRIGAGGAVALIVVIGSQVAALSSVGASSPNGPLLAAVSLVVSSALARAVPVVAVAVAPRRKPTMSTAATEATAATGATEATEATEASFGAWFQAQVRSIDAAVALATAVGLATFATFLTGEPALATGSVVGFVIGLGGLAAIAARRGGLDGDGFGAAIEIATTAALVAIAVLA